MTIVNFAIVIGMGCLRPRYCHDVLQIILLVLPALLWAVPVAVPAISTLAADLGGTILAL